MLESHTRHGALLPLRRENEALWPRLYNTVKCLGCSYLLWFSLSEGIPGRGRGGHRASWGASREMSDNRWKICGPKPFRAWVRRWIYFLASCTFFLFRFQGILRLLYILISHNSLVLGSLPSSGNSRDGSLSPLTHKKRPAMGRLGGSVG